MACQSQLDHIIDCKRGQDIDGIEKDPVRPDQGGTIEFEQKQRQAADGDDQQRSVGAGTPSLQRRGRVTIGFR